MSHEHSSHGIRTIEERSMMSRSAAVASATVVAWLLSAPSARAECFIITAQHVMAEKVYDITLPSLNV
jgi:hypothetical protein